MSLIQKVKRNMEGRNWLRRTEFILFIALLIATIVLFRRNRARQSGRRRLRP